MKTLRIAIVVFFVLTVVGYAVYTIQEQKRQDNVSPEIVSEEDTIEVGVGVSDEELLAGITATDDRDGDVTDSLVVVSKSKFMEKGKCRVNYAAFDSQNNVATYSRTLIYTDYVSPQFSLSTPLRYRMENWDYDLLSQISVTDCIDGDISGQVKLKYDGNMVYVGNDATQTVVFQVTNSAGDTIQWEADLEFLSNESYARIYPALSEYVVYTHLNEPVDAGSYLTALQLGDEIRAFEYYDNPEGNYFARDYVEIDEQVDYSTEGTYRIYYTFYQLKEIGEREAQGTTTLYVIVQE